MNIFGRKGKKEGQKSGPSSKAAKEQHQVLGLPLKQAVRNDPSFDGVPVPAIVRECLDYVALYGLQLEGIYRVSSPKSRLDELEHMANSDSRGNIIFQDAHEAAGLLKRFLRQLPEHILTPQLAKKFEDSTSKCRCEPMGICKCGVALEVKELLLQLPTENFHLLAFVFRHAQLVIQQESSNKMSLSALGVLLQAMFDNLFRPIVKLFILNASDLSGSGQWTQLFDMVDIKPYLKPKSIDELRKNPPGTLKEIEEEIFKQQNLLEYLHQQIQQGRQSGGRGEETKGKEDEMWAIQTGITVLKRRHKALLDEEQKGKTNVDEKEEDEGEAVSGIPMDESVGTALLEKQLLAVQISIREEITEEKRKIGQLLSGLRETLQLRNKLPELGDQNRLTDSQREANDESQHRPKSIVSIRSSGGETNNGFGLSGGRSRSRDDSQSQGSGNWEELCRVEEGRRERLLAELIRYRRICAQLRARLEHDTMLVKLKEQQQQRRPIGGCEVLLPVPISMPPQSSTNEKEKAPAVDTDDPTNLLVTRF